MFIMSAKELAPAEDQGVIFGILDASANSTLDQNSIYSAAVNQVFMSEPETDFTFQITFPNSGFGGMVVKPWDERKRNVFQIMPEVQQKLQKIPGIQIFPVTPPALPGGGDFPVEFVLASTAETAQILEFAKQLQMKAMQSGMFAFPPLIDVKIDQPQSEFVIDRDKVAALGLNLGQVGGDLGGMVGGDFVNRFDISGRSYKVIPQIQRVGRLNPGPAQGHLRHRPERQTDPAQHHRHPARIGRAPLAQPLPAVERGQDQRRGHPAAGRGLALPGGRGGQDPAQGYVLDYTGESRQLRTEGNKFLPAFGLAIILIFLVLAAQFNSFRDPFVILAGSVPLAMFGALIFTFLKMPDPNVPFWTRGWTTTLNIYSQVGLVTLVGLVSKNGILIVEFANKLQLQGHPSWRPCARRP